MAPGGTPSWSRIALRGLPVLLTVALLELGLHALDLPRWDYCWITKEPFWVEDPELGFTYRPGSEVADAQINALGLRGPVVPRTKPAGTRRILFVGDSTCFGLAVELEEAFAVIASEVLARESGAVTDYVIAAIPGYSSYHDRVLLERMLPYEPDWVVFYVGAHNDHSRARYYRDAEIPQRMARRQAAWHRIRTLHMLEFLRDVTYRTWWRKLRPAVRQTRVLPGEFEENMRAMLQAAGGAGARSLVVLPPVSGELAEDHPMIPAYQEALVRVSAEAGAAQLALQPLFVAHPEEEVYFADRFHFSEGGHRIAGEAIGQRLAEAEAQSADSRASISASSL